MISLCNRYTGEYSCRCHGKRVISAPSKPLKLKLAGHILQGETRLRTEGFCSAPLRSRDIRDKVRNGILALFRDQLYFSATKQRRTKSFGTHVHNTSNNTSTKLQLQRIKLHIEIVNLKPVTPTTILLPTMQGPRGFFSAKPRKPRVQSLHRGSTLQLKERNVKTNKRLILQFQYIIKYNYKKQIH